MATDFYYFGAKRISIPGEFEPVIRKVQGIQYTEGLVADAFVAWLRAGYNPGVQGQPQDLADRSHETGTMVTEYLADAEVLGIHTPSHTSLPPRSRARGCQ